MPSSSSRRWSRSRQTCHSATSRQKGIEGTTISSDAVALHRARHGTANRGLGGTIRPRPQTDSDVDTSRGGVRLSSVRDDPGVVHPQPRFRHRPGRAGRSQFEGQFGSAPEAGRAPADAVRPCYREGDVRRRPERLLRCTRDWVSGRRCRRAWPNRPAPGDHGSPAARQ